MANNGPKAPPESISKQSSKKKQNQKKINPWLIALIIFVVLSIILVGTIFAIKFFSADPLQSPIVQDDSWQKIQKAGVLRVATSADYTPFAYYNEELKIDGFEIALIKEIGAKLSIDVEITDFAFDGLLANLVSGQVDVVIAGISLSPKREAIVDFSNVYYVGQDGILAQTDSGIGLITNPGQMAGMRIGVQSLSIYQDWAQVNLVETGIISQDKLFVYAKPEDAVGDLRLGRLDLVVMDLHPATAALALGNLKIVGQGLNQQRFAIALSQGATSLKVEINRALQALQNEGKVTELAGIYLGLKPEDVIPSPTPEACIDAMEIVEDLNYHDEDLTKFPNVDPSEAFQKGFRIKNSGSCNWTSVYFIKYVHGNDSAAQMQGQPTAIMGEVKPGQTYDIYIDLIAPEADGTFIGYWQMFNGDNKAFGQTISVAVRVATTETPEPTVTVTTAVTATLTLEPTATEFPPDPIPTKPGSDLRDTNWVLAGYLADFEDEELTEPVQDVEVMLLFEEGDTFNGNAGCNTYNGRYVTNGKQILFKNFTVSLAICEQPEGIMEQEALYLILLESAEEYRFNDDNQLELIRFINNDNNEREEKILLAFDGLLAELR